MVASSISPVLLFLRYAVRSNGYIPLFINADLIFSVVIALYHASMKIGTISMLLDSSVVPYVVSLFLLFHILSSSNVCSSSFTAARELDEHHHRVRLRSHQLQIFVVGRCLNRSMMLK